MPIRLKMAINLNLLLLILFFIREGSLPFNELYLNNFNIKPSHIFFGLKFSFHVGQAQCIIECNITIMNSCYPTIKHGLQL
jgi:hypothetical protein